LATPQPRAGTITALPGIGNRAAALKSALSRPKPPPHRASAMSKTAPSRPRKTPAAWRVDGISPEAVKRATQAAERAGLPLAEWLAPVIRETAARERQGETPHESARQD